MNAKSTKTKSARTRTKWRTLKAMKDSDIDYSDIPKTDRHFWAQAKIVMPPAKTHLSLRLDEDVVEWFKRQGAGYQTRMNAVLRAYVRHKAKIDGND
jgi:uncharacterized protein (DUF4415 family)